jgi:hypothetical protein
MRAHSFSVGQIKEQDFPFDRAFGVGNKIIGFQVKRPVVLHEPWIWTLDAGHDQHKRLAASRWVMYALPDFTDVSHQDVALFHFRFALPADIDTRSLPTRYQRWGSVADQLLACTRGSLLTEHWSSFEQFADAARANPADVYVTVNRDAHAAWIIDAGPLVR